MLQYTETLILVSCPSLVRAEWRVRLSSSVGKGLVVILHFSKGIMSFLCADTLWTSENTMANHPFSAGDMDQTTVSFPGMKVCCKKDFFRLLFRFFLNDCGIDTFIFCLIREQQQAWDCIRHCLYHWSWGMHVPCILFLTQFISLYLSALISCSPVSPFSSFSHALMHCNNIFIGGFQPLLLSFSFYTIVLVTSVLLKLE